MSGKVFRNGASGLALSVVVACAAPQSADNLEPVAIGGAYQAQYRQIDTDRDAAQFLQSATMNAAKCRPAIGGDSLLSDQKYTSGDLYALRGELLSRGDLVEFRLPEDETFSGDYVVSRDGTVKLPFIAPVSYTHLTLPTILLV